MPGNEELQNPNARRIPLRKTASASKKPAKPNPAISKAATEISRIAGRIEGDKQVAALKKTIQTAAAKLNVLGGAKPARAKTAK